MFTSAEAVAIFSLNGESPSPEGTTSPVAEDFSPSVAPLSTSVSAVTADVSFVGLPSVSLVPTSLLCLLLWFLWPCPSARDVAVVLYSRPLFNALFTSLIISVLLFTPPTNISPMPWAASVACSL